jgi:acetyl esterase
MILRILFATALHFAITGSLLASPSTRVYGFDFSKHYPDPDNRDSIMEDMMAVLRQGEEITYRTTEEEALKLWIFAPHAPKGKTAREKLPAIVFIHGGGWGGGHAAYFSPQAVYFAQRGIVSVTINYRLTKSLTENIPEKIRKEQESTIEDCVRDAKSAIRWLRSHADNYNIDRDQIIISGGSAGAHITACLASMDQFNNPEDDLDISPRPNAMVLFNPAIDFVDSEEGRNVGLPQAKRLGLPLEAISPAHLVDENTPPTLILSGEKDPLIPPALVYKFLDRMKAHDRPARYVEYMGASHGFFNFWPPHNAFFASTLEQADKYLIELGYLSGEPLVQELVTWYKTEPEMTIHNN